MPTRLAFFHKPSFVVVATVLCSIMLIGACHDKNQPRKELVCQLEGKLAVVAEGRSIYEAGGNLIIKAGYDGHLIYRPRPGELCSARDVSIKPM